MIAAAGDISCDPLSGVFNAGLGSQDQCRQLYTSDLLTAEATTRCFRSATFSTKSARTRTSCSPTTCAGDASSRSPVRLRATTSTTPRAQPATSTTSTGSATRPGPPAIAAKGYYSYDLGSWHLIALNSNCARSAAAAPAPRRSTGWRLTSRRATRAARSPTGTTRSSRRVVRRRRRRRAAALQALYDNGADVVLNGHDHNYERFAPRTRTGSPTRAASGSSSSAPAGEPLPQGAPVPNSEVRNATTFGVLAYPAPVGYDWKFVPAAGKTFTDSGSEGCRNASNVPPSPDFGRALPGAPRPLLRELRGSERRSRRTACGAVLPTARPELAEPDHRDSGREW